MTAIESQQLGMLRWRCRRGMKELDLLLTRYIEERYRDAPLAHQAAFQELLESQDTVIYAYCLGQERPPTALLSSLIEQITLSSVDQRSGR
jgi:antitoxin CptB